MHFTIINLCSKLLKNNNLTIAFAENITGGKIAYDFSTLKDSTEFLKGGIVCFDINLYEKVFGVPNLLSEEFSPQSAEVTEAMAMGLEKLIPANLHVAVNGARTISNNNDEIGLNTIYIHALLNSNTFFSRQFQFEGAAETVVNQIIVHVAYFLRHYLVSKENILNHTA